MRNTLLSVSVALACFAVPASAGGFFVQEQSAVAQGRAFAGAAANADDAQSQWFNPALLTSSRSDGIAGSASLLFLRTEQANQGTTLNGRPVNGGNGGNPFYPVTPVPSAAVAFRIAPDTVVGLSVNAPFGLIVNYDPDWFGRYDSIRSRLFTMNIGASVAQRFGPFSVGVGVDPQYIEAELTSALPNPLPIPGGAPDGLQQLKGNDWTIGWHAGATFEQGPVTLGVSYRKGVTHRLDGDLIVSGLLGPLAAANGTQDATATVSLPSILSFGAKIQATPRLAISAGANRFTWSRFDAIRIRTAAGQNLTQEQDYRNTWSYAVGADYAATDALTLRAGVQRDQTPTTDEFRSTRVPDGNRTFLSAGGSYAVSEALRLNASYTHIFVSEERIDRTDPFFQGTPLASAATTRSLNSGAGDILSVSASLRF